MVKPGILREAESIASDTMVPAIFFSYEINLINFFMLPGTNLSCQRI